MIMRGLKGQQTCGVRRLNGHYQSNGQLKPWAITGTGSVLIPSYIDTQYIGFHTGYKHPYELHRKQLHFNLKCDFSILDVLVTPNTLLLSPLCQMSDTKTGIDAPLMYQNIVSDNPYDGIYNVTQSGVYNFTDTASNTIIAVECNSAVGGNEIDIVFRSTAKNVFTGFSLSIAFKTAPSGTAGIIEKNYTSTISYERRTQQ